MLYLNIGGCRIKVNIQFLLLFYVNDCHSTSGTTVRLCVNQAIEVNVKSCNLLCRLTALMRDFASSVCVIWIEECQNLLNIISDLENHQSLPEIEVHAPVGPTACYEMKPWYSVELKRNVLYT